MPEKISRGHSKSVSYPSCNIFSNEDYVTCFEINSDGKFSQVSSLIWVNTTNSFIDFDKNRFAEHSKEYKGIKLPQGIVENK